MKRVLMVLPADDVRWTVSQVRLLVPHLAAAGYDVQGCALGSGPAISLDQDMPWATIAGRHPLDPTALRALRRHIQRLAPNLVHAWLPTYAPLWRLMTLAHRGRPWLVSQPGFEPAANWWQAQAERLRLSGIRAWTVSHPAAYALALAAGIPASDVHVIAGGVHAAAAPTMTRIQWLQSHGLPSESRVIGAAGRLDVRGGWKDLIWAADMLKFIRDDVHLFISGDGPLRSRLQRFRRQACIEDKVHLLPAGEELSDWVAHCDVFWSGRSDNGLPLELLLAMAAGVPAIATELPGIEQLMEHGRTGYRASVGDRAGIARLTRKLLDDPELARTLGRQGRERAAARFSPQRLAVSFLGLYQQLVPD